MDKLPIQPGTYALILTLAQSQNISVGRLGDFDFPAGFYIYVGSARGPGGIRARLGRHLRGGGVPHWHIDYLRAVAQVWDYRFQIGSDEKRFANPIECQWSQVFAAMPNAVITVPGFGASDCKAGCPAHLIYLANLEAKDLPGFYPIR